MDEKLKFFIFYLVFLFLWTCIALASSKGLKWIAKHYIGSSTLNQKKKGSVNSKLKGYLAFQLILILSVIFFRKIYMTLIILIFSVALFEFIYQMVKSKSGNINKIISIISCLIVSSVTVFSYIYLYSLINYRILVYILFVLSVSDSFSQIVGESLKGPRLFPEISPGKTWSGLTGGFIFSIIGSLSFYYAFKPGLSIYFVLVTTCIIFISGFTGDAGVSCIKRWIGIKDFSNILGAQGGMLDRVDSMILLGPIVSTFFTFYRI